MARIVQLEEGIFVAPQLVESDFAAIAARGFRAVVNNRPDGEAADQLANAQAEAAAGRQGLVFRHEPVISAEVTDDGPVETFARSMRELPRPVLFYCRSGTRCTTLWAQASAARLGTDEVIRVAAEAGYDLEALRPFIGDRAGLVDAA